MVKLTKAGKIAKRPASLGSSNALIFGSQKKADYLELLQEGGWRVASAKAIGLNYETIRLHIVKDKVFRKAVEDAEAAGKRAKVERLEIALQMAGESGNMTAIIFALQNLDPENWKDRRNVNATLQTPDGKPLQVCVYLPENQRGAK